VDTIIMDVCLKFIQLSYIFLKANYGSLITLIDLLFHENFLFDQIKHPIHL